MTHTYTTGFPNRIFMALKSTRLVRPGLTAIMLAMLAACGSKGAVGTPEAAMEDSPVPAQVAASTQPAPAVGGNMDFLATLNPCELLTPAELESFFGEPAATDAAPEDIGPYRSCMFTSKAGTKMIILQVTHETAAQFKTDNEGSAAMLEMIPTPVRGLGDETVFFSGLLRVRTGDVVTQVVTWHTEAEQEQAFSMTQEIARLAISRLPK
jgi:predicted small lipoprotein YifL